MSEPWDISDFDRLSTYCSDHADEFGGRFADGEQIFGVLFTDHVPEHDVALRQLLSHPELLTVRIADRPWRDVEAAKDRIVGLLLTGPKRHPAVNYVGIGLHDGQFRVVVMIDSSQREAEEEIRLLAQPEPLTTMLVGKVHRRSA